MNNFNDTTSVKINKEKKDLVKSKGLKLQDILDSALNEILGIENQEINKLMIKQLDEQIESLIKERDEAIKDCQKKIDILINNLIKSKDHEEDNYNKKINVLKIERDLIKSRLY